jgi:peptidoglycan biosynthesis protein MviN/MurJ (putative lipid II flippase)
MGLLLLSRLIGVARESAIVGLIGVHDYTDAYFALSAVVAWLQNWSFGAYSLYFVPKYLRLGSQEREPWVRRRTWVAGALGVALALGFLLLFRPIERLMLGGVNVLHWGPAVLLAVCLPVTATAGVKWGEVISHPGGILSSARALAIANALGLFALLGVVGAKVDRSLALPASLAISQVVTLLLLARQAKSLRVVGGYAETDSKAARTSDTSQVVATTLENVGFNASAMIQQAIAGSLSAGAITLNAYATRLILVPLTGLMQPVQQRLLIRFASDSSRRARQVLRTTVLLALAVGGGLGLLLGIGGYGMAPLLNGWWRQAFLEHHYPLVLCAYAVYAGVVFANQSMARLFFSEGRGAAYATVMCAAYVVGNALRFMSASRVGLVALPAGALIAEGAATALLFRLAARSPEDDADAVRRSDRHGVSKV